MPPQDDDVRESRQAIDNLLDEIPTVPKIQTATGPQQRPNPRRSERPVRQPQDPSPDNPCGVHSGSPASGPQRGTYLSGVGFQKLQHVAEHLRPAEFQSMPILLKDYELAMVARFPRRFLN